MSSRFISTPLTRLYLVGFLSIVCLGASGIISAPSISSTQTDSFADVNGDGKADPGEQVDYTTAITNSGDLAAEDVVYSDGLPADTTMVAGSVKTTPLARDDLYASVGNVGLSVPNANGVLANDYDLGPTDPAVADPVPGVSTLTVKGGSVVFSAGGGFIYTPPAGFEGVDTFSYTIADETGPVLPAPATGANIATVTITVDNMIWFIDNSGLAGNGSMQSPFNSLAQHNTNPNDNDGDCIFVHSGNGNYSSGILLQPGQVLVGEGSSESLADTCGIALPPYSLMLPPTGGTRPVLLNSGGDAIFLSSGNTVRGVNVGDTLGSGIYGSGFGTATIYDVAVATTGMGIYLDTGTLDAAFDSVSKLSSPHDGIVLNNVAGVADFGVLSIVSTGPGRGIWLDGTAPATSSFSASGSLASADGTALDCSDCKLGTGAGITFDNVSSDGGSDPGINLRSVAGTLSITGGTIKNKLDTDGIRLQDTAELISLSNMVIREISGTGDASPADSPIALDGGPYSHHSGADGIHGENVLGGLSLDTVTIERVSDNAINGELLTATYSPTFHPTVWNGLLLKDCTFRDSNRYHIAGQLDDRNSNFIESQVHIHGIRGQVTISGCEFTRGAGLLHLVSANTGTLRADITGNDFLLSQKEMSASAFSVGGPQSVGGAAIEIYGQGNAVLDVIIGDLNEANPALGNSFENCGAGALGSLRLQTGLSGLFPFTGDFDAVVSRNTFRVTDHFSDANPGSFQGFPQGHLEFLLEGNGVAEAAVSHNVLEQLQGPGDGPAAFTFTTGQGMNAELMLNNNTMDKAWNRICSFQAFSSSEQTVKSAGNVYIGDTAFPYTVNDDQGFMFGPSVGVLPFEGNLIRTTGEGGYSTSIDFTAENENVVAHDTLYNYFSNHAFDFENFHTGTTDIELDNNNPVLGFEFHEASGGSPGTINLYRDISASMDIATVLADNGNTGAVTDNSGGVKQLYIVSSDPTIDPTITVP